MLTLISALITEIFEWDSMIIFYTLVVETMVWASGMVAFAIMERKDEKSGSKRKATSRYGKYTAETQSYLVWKETHGAR